MHPASRCSLPVLRIPRQSPFEPNFSRRRAAKRSQIWTTSSRIASVALVSRVDPRHVLCLRDGRLHAEDPTIALFIAISSAPPRPEA
jgi:hypothetical protein